MKINMHERTPKTRMDKYIKIILTIFFVLTCVFFIMGSFALMYNTKNILNIFCGIFLLILPIVGITLFIDISNSYVELREDEIRVVNYYFFLKKQKVIKCFDVDYSKSIWSGSWKQIRRGFYGANTEYIVFYSRTGKYLFQILKTPEVLEFQKKIFEIKNKH